MKEDLWDKFVEGFFKALDDALDKGEPARLQVDGVTIDIYQSKAQMKVFDEMILGVAKKHRGIDVVKP